MNMAFPSDEICMQYAAGVLDPALKILVDAHQIYELRTKRRIEYFQKCAGALLNAERPVELAGDALDRTLARLDTANGLPRAAAATPAGSLDLARLRWRWAGPGRRIARISVDGSRFKTFALDVGPGRAMIEHSHEGEEWTLVLRGAFHDKRGAFGVGAFVEEDEDTVHSPVAGAEDGCLCVAVLSAPLSAPGLSGSLARWFLN